MFRICCLNSLVTQAGTIDTVKMRHSGDVNAKVIEGTYHLLGEAQKALVGPADWSALTPAREERVGFAKAAHLLRFGDAEGEVTTPITAEQLLTPNRYVVRGGDLWTTFNVAQKNVIRGGLQGWAVGDDNRRRRVTTRPFKGIDQDVRLNKALWVLAEEMAKLKKAA